MFACEVIGGVPRRARRGLLIGFRRHAGGECIDIYIYILYIPRACESEIPRSDSKENIAVFKKTAKEY